MELMPIDRKIVAEFGGHRHEAWITGAKFSDSAFAEYTIKINLKKSIREEKEAMANTHNWQAGEKVIVTANPKNGKVFCETCFDSETPKDYEGEVTAIFNNEICVHVPHAGASIYFNLDGSCSTHPGMSIRPAEAKEPVKELPTTPSQWIEGRCQREKPGIYAIYDSIRKEIYSIVMREDSIFSNEGITHYQYLAPLPPPPPVKKVEAFGYLVAVDKLEKEVQVYTNETTRLHRFWERQDNARRFYSQPATAENLTKYLISESKESWGNCDADITLDQFINWFKKSTALTLYFTPATLKELGIK